MNERGGRVFFGTVTALCARQRPPDAGIVTTAEHCRPSLSLSLSPARPSPFISRRGPAGLIFSAPGHPPLASRFLSRSAAMTVMMIITVAGALVPAARFPLGPTVAFVVRSPSSSSFEPGQVALESGVSRTGPGRRSIDEAKSVEASPGRPGVSRAVARVIQFEPGRVRVIGGAREGNGRRWNAAKTNGRRYGPAIERLAA